MALSEGDRAIVAAIEILRREIAPSALAQAMNAAGTGTGFTNQTGGEAGLGRQPFKADWMQRNMRRAGDAAGILAASFGRLLTPLVVLGTFLSQQTSGFSVFSRALGLFAASIAVVLMPVFFTLAVGLVAASDVIFRKLLPAMDSFTKLVLSTGIPAVAQFAETAGRAAEALMKIANSPAAKFAAGGLGEGGIYGTINRTLGRLGMGDDPDRDRGTIASIESGLDDIARLVPGMGPGFVGAKGWVKRQLGFGGDEGEGASVLSSATTGAMGRALPDTLRELMLSVGPKASSGNVASVWSRAQMASLNQTPFERRMQEMVQQMLTIMNRNAGTTGPGSFTGGGGGVVGGALAMAERMVAMGARRGP